MFHKIISGLSYSPALVESLSKLATSLKNEEYLRRIGVVFLFIALVVQSLVLLFPSNPSNVASAEDTFYGGFSSLDKFMATYSSNDKHLRDMLISLGITRYDILQSKVNSAAQPSNVYKISSLSSVDNERDKLFEYRISGDITDESRQIAYVEQSTIDTNKHTVYTGETQFGNWFGINMNNGDVLINELPSNVSVQDVCPVEPLSENVKCSEYYSHTAYNQTKSSDATKQPAESDDHIIYSFTVTNPESASKPVTVPFKANIYDALEYSKVLDSGGGIYDSHSGTVTWPSLQVEPGQSITHTVSLVMLHDIPATSTGLSNQSSYDCIIGSTLAVSNLSVPVKCPAIKQLESVTSSLPHMSKWIIVTEAVVLIVIIYLYIRSRHTKEEVRLIRKDINSGTIQ